MGCYLPSPQIFRKFLIMYFFSYILKQLLDLGQPRVPGPCRGNLPNSLISVLYAGRESLLGSSRNHSSGRVVLGCPYVKNFQALLQPNGAAGVHSHSPSEMPSSLNGLFRSQPLHWFHFLNNFRFNVRVRTNLLNGFRMAECLVIPRMCAMVPGKGNQWMKTWLSSQVSLQCKVSSFYTRVL